MMPAMRRWLFNVAAAVSVLLLSLTIGLSVHLIPTSLFGWGDMQLARGYSLHADNGTFAFQVASLKGLPSGATFTLLPSGSGFDAAGFHHHHWIANGPFPMPNVVGSMDESSVSVAWLIAFFSILPVVWFIRRVGQRAKALPGYCIKCGYD